MMDESGGMVGIDLNSTDKSEVVMVELMLSPRGSRVAAFTLPRQFRDELMHGNPPATSTAGWCQTCQICQGSPLCQPLEESAGAASRVFRGSLSVNRQQAFMFVLFSHSPLSPFHFHFSRCTLPYFAPHHATVTFDY